MKIGFNIWTRFFELDLVYKSISADPDFRAKQFLKKDIQASKPHQND